MFMPLYNMEKLQENLEKFEECFEAFSSKDNFINSYICKVHNYLGNFYDEETSYHNGIVLGCTAISQRWNDIINDIKECDEKLANQLTANVAQFGGDDSINAILIAQGIIDGFSGIFTSYSSIKLGGEVGEYNVTKGHDTAAWAVDGKNVEDLNAKHVTKESQFMRFAVVNEDGSIGYISNEKGITLEQFCVDNNVPPERVAVDVGSKDGKSQAWVSVKELTDGVTSTSAGNNGIKKAVDSSQASGKTTATKTDNSQAAYIFTDEELELSESINAYKAYDNNIKSLQQEKEQCTDQDRIDKINYLISENEEGKKRSKRAINSKIDYIDDIESKLYIANEKLRWSPKNNDSYYDDYLNKQEIEKLSTLKLEAEKIINNDNN